MGKFFLAAILIMSFSFYGCEALNSHYDDAGLEDVSLDENLTVDGGSEIIDYTVDTSECEHNFAISISVNPAVETANDGFTADAESVVAEKTGAYTTQVKISKGSEDLSFTLKQIDDAMFNVCDVIYESCPDEECLGVKSLWTEVESGEITVSKFNVEGEEGAIINGGTYNIIFGPSSQGDAGVTLEGSYLIDILGEEVATETEEE